MYISSGLLWQHLENNKDEEVAHWLPTQQRGKWYFMNCVNRHWILVMYDCQEKILTQYDTLRRDTGVAKRLKRFIGTTKVIQDIKVQAHQPIVQTDGHSCGVHVIELICQLETSVKFPK